MKCLRLRFENHIGIILFSALFSVGMICVAWVAFDKVEIATGVIAVVFGAVMFVGLMYFVLYVEVVIDFKHNRLKMRSGDKKRKCNLDKVKKLDIVFSWVDEMECYSAHVKAFLKNGRSLAIKVYPERSWSRGLPYVSGKVSELCKTRIEEHVKDYDFITCRTEKPLL